MNTYIFKASLIVSLFFGAAIWNTVYSQKLKEVLIIENDSNTIKCSIRKLKGKEKTLYNGILISHNGIEEELTPEEIKGYCLKDKCFKSVNFSVEGLNGPVTINVFAEILFSGERGMCFFFQGNKDMPESAYIFKKIGEKDYKMINSDLINEVRIGNDDNSIPSIQEHMFSKSNKKAFMEFIINYFSDCDFVVNKFKSEFYAISDLKYAFEDYENCHLQSR